MKTKQIVIIFALIAFLSTMSLAQQIEISPFVGYRTSGSFEIVTNDLDYSNMKIKDGFAYGLTLGYRMNDIFTIEAMWSHVGSQLSAEVVGADTDTLFDLSEDQFHCNFLFFASPGMSKVRPYGLLGLGLTYFNPKPSEVDGETRFSFSLGAGFVAMVSQQAGIRLQAKWAPSYINTTSALFIGWWGQPWVVPVNNYMSQWEFTGGLVFRF